MKYIAIVMRADNQGEGGILALTALLPTRNGNGARPSTLVLMGIFGAALLYGDGMITPAITVLGAVEGSRWRHRCSSVTSCDHGGDSRRRVRDPETRHHRVGGLFGPVMVLWFVVIAGLGITWAVSSRLC